MHVAFTEGLQDRGLTRMGDAVRYAKNSYLNYGLYAPQAYGSVLLGDPAMQIVHAELSVAGTAQQSGTDTYTFVTTVQNNGVLSTAATVTQTLSSDLQIESIELSANATAANTQSTDTTLLVQVANLAMQESATITVTAHIIDPGRTPVQIYADATVAGAGFEVNLTDNSAEITPQPTAPTAVTLTHTTAQTSSLSITFLITILTIATLLYRHQAPR